MVVMNVLGFLAVVTNASMITFVGSQDAEEHGLLCSHRLTEAAREGCQVGFFLFFCDFR